MAAIEPSPWPAARLPGAGLQAAQHAAEAAERAAAAGHTALSWHELRQWPTWAAHDPVCLTWLQTLGACWHAAELQRCIDGARLNALREAWGAAKLTAVLQLDITTAPPPPLNGADSVTQWLDQLAARGRAVALASLASPALRQAVAAVLGWHETAAALPTTAVLAWLTLAQD